MRSFAIPFALILAFGLGSARAWAQTTGKALAAASPTPTSAPKKTVKRPQAATDMQIGKQHQKTDKPQTKSPAKKASGAKAKRRTNTHLAPAPATPKPLSPAEGGVLPQGDTSADEASMPTAMAAVDDSGGKRRNCYLDLATPPGGPGEFTADGKELYLLANPPVEGVSAKIDAKRGKVKKKSGNTRSVLYRVDLATRRAEPMLALDSLATGLVTHGSPPEAVTTLVFAGEAANCLEGDAQMVSIALQPQDGETAVVVAGSYAIAEGPSGRVVADMKKRLLVELDAVAFQSKPRRKLPAHERPLFYDLKKGTLISWHDDGKQRGLVRTEGESDSAVRRVAFKAGDRLLQSGELFALGHWDGVGNTIEISELPEWTKAAKPGRYKIELGAAFPVGAATAIVNLARRHMIVLPTSLIAKQQWGRVFLYDYTKKKPLAVLATDARQYVSYAGIDPTGATAVFELRDVGNRATVALRLFDFAKKSFYDLDLPVPQ